MSVFTCNKFYTVTCVFRKNIVLFVKRRGDSNTVARAAPSFVKYIDALYYKVVFEVLPKYLCSVILHHLFYE